MSNGVICNQGVQVQKTEWGSLQWLVSKGNGASQHMTFGRVTLNPGQGNPMHYHPNCEEILFVVTGEIEHTLPAGGMARLQAGDCIVIPIGSVHHAINVGDDEAAVIVAFSAVDRQTVIV